MEVYGDSKKACDDVNLTINAEDICAFIGHNGVGKSTTVKAVVGDLDFSEGELIIIE